MVDLEIEDTLQDDTGDKCAFPAVLDVVLFNREQILVLQTSAVGIPLPSIKWYGKLSGNSTSGWKTLESTMFDKRNDSIASFAKIDFFEGTLNILCVAENVAGSSHEEICLTTDVSEVLSKRCILIKFDPQGRLLTWITPDTLMPSRIGLRQTKMMAKNETVFAQHVIPISAKDVPTPTNTPTIESSVNGGEIAANTNLPSSTIQMKEVHNDKPVHFSTRIGRGTVLPTSVTHLTTTRKLEAASQSTTEKPRPTEKTVVSRKKAQEILVSRTYQEKILASLHLSPNGYFRNRTIGDWRFGDPIKNIMRGIDPYVRHKITKETAKVIIFFILIASVMLLGCSGTLVWIMVSEKRKNKKITKRMSSVSDASFHK
ncbi:Oidioi.mRNA.OKI2018_I69.chr1.g3003.t1.cds [Oikopleura dioica]|uniref:Oidioi.mRNA.OKI2018_I69.chr1.g3003.t1.cds n=1 Tax=Oikopleura dioica TaxID=34765 RepID=A0ABN7SSQ0_OIKDI|nr:Oidioi.mRNA.OKI2018_I69.chr1.g3003.t1.cds [Oikopleura dioica]